MRSFIFIVLALATASGALLIRWRRDPRMGSAFVNSVVNPWLVSRGLAGGRHSEVGPLEHIGRTSGIRRLAPVHPEPTPDGFRIMVPLGTRSQWARNVLAAGRCRLQLQERVYELVEPRLVPARDLDDPPAVARAVMSWLGFHYLSLRTASVHPGTLEA